ncbi:Structural maintenance of chromosomes protein 5 [Cyphellophora attinorum]|uniref:Structural maintenance of chromosomes protein 5 n=1 Tax=Cyphellophora attinorum TaxID=1664694 RepID=A0A0N1HWY3_9EURO|nr:Structural maintenance of chromosomes protein 5 [Phialophora attinorum]KPI44885.1 Structural maintenance of chromosomes protein 5 [Phialophora attinorum]
MARLAVRRTRSPESDDEDEVTSRPRTPASTAANDRKRARRSTRDDDSSDDESSGERSVPKATQQTLTRPISKAPLTNLDPYPQHQPGAIVRVKLKNFVTYTLAEFKPGPSLNMVIGPNGTGKSTLVCAICLGLGWPASLLGRGDKIGEFVKHGAAEAYIEIELKGKPKENGRVRNSIIARKMRKDGNKNDWWINGNPSTEKAVRTHAQSFSIQIDNLCQFLPQDKVVQFAQMDPKEILKSTQQAAGDAQMTKHHETLIQLRAVQKDKVGAQRANKEELQNLTKRQEMQQAEVERLRDRAKHKEKLEWLERAALIPEFFTAKARTETAKQTSKRLERELNQLREESGPALRKVNSKQKYHQNVQKLVKERSNELKTAQEEAKAAADAVAELQTHIDDFNTRIATDKKMAQSKQQGLAKQREELARLQAARDQPVPDFDPRAMNAEITDRDREIEALDDKKREAEDRAREMQRQRRVREQALAEKEENIRKFDTTSGQLEQRFEAINKEAARAWKWIQANQNIFEKPVLGPPALVCNVPDLTIAPAIESILQKSDLCIFTAQTHNDYIKLQDKLSKEQGLSVALRVRPDDNMDSMRKPYSTEELQSYGLDSYAIDHIEGPQKVLAMLCDEKKLHLAAIAKGQISSEQHERLMVRSRIGTYFSQGTIHKFIRRAELGPQATISSSSVARPPIIWTDKPVDLGRKAALQREVSEIKGELEEIQSGIEDRKKEFADAGAKIKELNEQKKQIEADKARLQRELSTWNGLPGKIDDLNRKIGELDRWLKGAVDRRRGWNAEREDTMIKRAEGAVQYAERIGTIKECMAKLIAAEVQEIEAASDVEVLGQRNEAIRDMLKAKTDEEKEAADTAHEMLQNVRRMMKAAQKLQEEAKRLSDDGDPVFLTLIKEMIRDKWTPEHHRAEIEAVNAQIELTGVGNGDAIRQYEERQKKIESLQAAVANSETQIDEALRAIKEVRDQWEPAVEALVAKISDAFAESFARIGCAGQVEVGKAHSKAPEDCVEENGGEENGLDFANWRINISVKFREHEPLSLLDNHRQSGGERAVSTIFYLMALQSLSRAPFRVVDEINQGMDGRNERMVHGRMVDVACAEREDGGGGGSQYFLITPKLLSGLKYRRGMTILCIVSGEHVPAEGQPVDEDAGNAGPYKNYPTLGDFLPFARKYAALGLGGGSTQTPALGRRVDSGVAMVGAVSG